jgi:MFS family permease
VKVVLFAAIGSLFSGYSLAVIVATVGQPTWYSSLHLVADPTAPGYSHTTTIIGAVNGVFFAAGFLGTLLSGWLNDRLGRVNSIRIAATVGIIGGILQTAAVNQAMVRVATFKSFYPSLLSLEYDIDIPLNLCST